MRWYAHPRLRRVAIWTAVLGTFLITVVWSLYALLTAFNEKQVAVGSLKTIAIALHEYHDQHGGFPPAVARDEGGAAEHSWRMLIAPFLDRDEGGHVARLVDAYDYSKRWDSPDNLEAIRGFLPPPMSYLGVFGSPKPWSAGAFPTHDGRTLDPIIVVQVPNAGIKWSEPRDLYFNGRELFLVRADGGRSLLDPRGLRAVRWSGSFAVIPEDVTADTLGAVVADERY